VWLIDDVSIGVLVMGFPDDGVSEEALQGREA
jgi:hypothetical protein